MLITICVFYHEHLMSTSNLRLNFEKVRIIDGIVLPFQEWVLFLPKTKFVEPIVRILVQILHNKLIILITLYLRNALLGMLHPLFEKCYLNE